MDQHSNDDGSDLVKQLLAVKRHEKPDEQYFENFLADFKDRQRSEMLSQSARGLLAERVSTWWWDGGSKWVYGASAATVAAVAMGVFISPDKDPKDSIAADQKPTGAAEFELQIPGFEKASVRPDDLPSKTSSLPHGYVPVSTNSFQEL